MNSLTHLLFALNLLLFVFGDTQSFYLLLLFSFLFGVIVDADVFWRIGVLRRTGMTRTWLQEPFGFLVVGGLISVVLQGLFGSPYAMLVLVPYASHLFLDYISVHEVRPFDPFSKRVFCVGFVDVRLLKMRI